jgi:hypothetical protein
MGNELASDLPFDYTQKESIGCGDIPSLWIGNQAMQVSVEKSG